MHLLNFNDDEWDCIGTTTAKEAAKFIEAGFQYVTTIEGIQLFKNANKPFFSLSNRSHGMITRATKSC
jgi:hypothetical protein